MATILLYITLNCIIPTIPKEAKPFPSDLIYSETSCRNYNQFYNEYKRLLTSFFYSNEPFIAEELYKEDSDHSEEEQPDKLIIPLEINYGKAIGLKWLNPETFSQYLQLSERTKLEEK